MDELDLVEAKRTEILTRYFEKFPHLNQIDKLEISLISRGISAGESAALKGLSKETIRSRRKKIYQKLGVHSKDTILSDILAISLEALRG